MSTAEEKPQQLAAETAAAPAVAEAPKENETPAPATESTPPVADAPKESEAPAPAAETIKPAEPAAPAEAEKSAPAADSKPAPAVSEGPIPWPVVDDDHPLSKFLSQLPTILEEADYNEVYGITLDPSQPAYTKLILQKFLRANANDIDKARGQLLATLKWRKEFQPLKARDETFSKERFGGLGYVTVLTDVPGSGNKQDVVTFNIYGAVKDKKATFQDTEGFLRWRVALAELGLEKLNLKAATKPIPDFGQGPDPYQGIQIHDYLNVSFLRMDPYVKASSKETIALMQQYYPETLARKFFINVPVIMGWIYAAMKVFVAKETQKKFTILSYGKDLAGELGSSLPSEYGGKAGDLPTISEELDLKETEGEANGAAAKDAPKAAPKEDAKEAPKEAPKEEVKEAPKEEAKEPSNDETKV